MPPRGKVTVFRRGDITVAHFTVPGRLDPVGVVKMHCYKGMVVYGQPDVPHCRVFASEVVRAWRRRGVATALYRRLAKAAKRYGCTLHSDKHLSPAAERLWESFVHRGWAVATEGRYWYRWTGPT